MSNASDWRTAALSSTTAIRRVRATGSGKAMPFADLN
jgi:hypothetical protein